MKFLHLVVSAVLLSSTSTASACSNLGGHCDLFTHCCGTLKCSSTERGLCGCANLGESCSDGYGFRPPGCCQGLVCDQPADKGGKCIIPPNESKYDCPPSFTVGSNKYVLTKKKWYSTYFLCTYSEEGKPNRVTSDCDYKKDTGALGFHSNSGCPKQAPRA